MDHKIFSLFLPHSGCQNICIYCNQNFATGFNQKNISFEEQLESLKKSLNKINEIAIYAGNFTALKLDEQLNILRLINEITKGKIKIRISTRPDFINDETLIFLKGNNVKIIELGLQTANERILKILNRNYTCELVEKNNLLLKKYNFLLSYHIMYGLPEEKKEDFIDTLNFVAKLKPDFVRLHPTIVLKETQLCKLFFENKFKPLDLNTAIEYAKFAYDFFNKHNIKIIRFGLHSEKSLVENIVAGPYHPAFNQLVLSSLFLDKLFKIIKNYNFNSFNIFTNKKTENIIRGHKKENIKKLKEFGLKKIIIDESLENNNCKIYFEQNKKSEILKI
ncbi:MAG TPA: radical SAM protein [bacterium]|nr:radical SAM protein [bacterium]HOL46633.1 radical SAM protein [bacterium]HPQ17795.1 radical SAM protein [bacterium]